VTHVAWSTTDGVQSTLHYSRRPPGGTFSPDRVLPVDFAGAEFGGNYVVQDPAPSNRLVLITERCCQTPSTWALTSVDGGVTWTPARPVYEGSPAVNPTSGRVSVVASGPAGIWLMQGNPDVRAVLLPPSLAPVVPRSSSILLSSSAPYDSSVVIDPSGQPVFAYGDLHRTFVRPGPSGPELVAGNYPQLPSTIKIAGGPRGVLALVLGGTPGSAFLETRKLNGASLAAPVRLTTTADSNPIFPFVAADQTGRFHAVWVTRGGAVAYRRSEDGAAWGAQSTVVAGGGPVFDPVASAGPDGSGWVLWQQAAGPSAIFVAPLAGTAVAPPTPPPVPPPVAGRAVNVAVVRGAVRVRLRGTQRFVDLRRLRQIPTGSELDTTRGRVRLTSAATRGTQSGVFYDGRFVVTQARRGQRLTTLRLTAPLVCPRRSTAATAPPRRRLWGNAKGTFSTDGRYASAAVRGTVWLVQDTCAGTLVRSVRGRLEVFDKVRNRDVFLDSGQSYTARRR
jgi:hypothetical protein